ncbi:MAG: NADH-quinone oxidoreductase subunit C, partial [Nitrospira sp. CR1.2]|nr:NADH-quinone oxidoreductase subunit C [Nitrospira sp. CR1.2]
MSQLAQRIEDTFPGACSKVVEWRGDLAVTVKPENLRDVAR